jgi:hypothetical protein
VAACSAGALGVSRLPRLLSWSPRSLNLGTLITHNFTLNKTTFTGSVATHLRNTAGDTPTVKVEGSATGNITAVTAPPNPLPVTLTKVATC